MNTLLIEKTIRQLMRKKNTPGLAVGIVHNNEIIYAKGFGLRDLKQHKPMTADTLIGFITHLYRTVWIIHKAIKVGLGGASCSDHSVDDCNSTPSGKMFRMTMG